MRGCDALGKRDDCIGVDVVGVRGGLGLGAGSFDEVGCLVV